MSAGCVNCYAEAMASRFAGPGQPYEGLATSVNGHPRWTNTVRFIEKHLEDPLKLARPRRIFANSMSDLFHEGLSVGQIARIWAVMALSPRHTYQILTKRPERITPVLTHPDFYAAVRGEMDAIRGRRHTDRAIQHIHIADPATKPLPHVWLGTSVEDQPAADTRIPHLLDAPAAVRFLSCEPLIGPVDLDPYLWEEAGPAWAGKNVANPGIDWVIVGGESGPDFRPMDLGWAVALSRQCDRAGVSFFFKQDAAARPGMRPDALGAIRQAFPEPKAAG